MYTPATVEQMLNAQEGEHYQFKEAKSSFPFEEAARCCCALSNCGGGKLVFGVTDKRPRKVVGSHAFEQPERIRRKLQDKLHISVDFEEYSYQGMRVLVFQPAEHPIGLPVQFEGTAWWYDGDSLIHMPETVRRNIYFEGGLDFSSKVCLNASIMDLETRYIDEFRRRWAYRSENQRLMTLSDEQLLMDCNAITEDGVTYAALILFGKQKSLVKNLAQAEVIFEYRASDAAGPAAQRVEFREGFFGFYDEMWNLINLRNEKQYYQETWFVNGILTFNERVVREAVLNAICHRDYQMSGSVYVRQYADRLTIESPGGLPKGITVDNILDRQAPRNRRIAELLALCGLVERAGQGMNLIYELCIKESKQLPDLSRSDDYFVDLTIDGRIIDDGLISVFDRIETRGYPPLTTTDLLLIDALYHGRTLTNGLRHATDHLVELGIVKRAGRKKYCLAESLIGTKELSNVTVTTRANEERQEGKADILEFIRSNTDEGVSLKELEMHLPKHNKNQIQGMLRELRNAGYIVSDRKGPGARWYAKNGNDTIIEER